MAARRLEKEQEKIKQSIQEVSDELPDRFILCLKHGKKYDASYVNKLYNGVKKHCTLDFKMVCLTDDNRDIHPDVLTIPLPAGLNGWWCKPYMFSKDLPIQGEILYLDLDVVIAGNIDKLFTFSPGHWCVIRDFTRAMRPNWKKYNSSVVRFKTGQLDHVWTEYAKDPRAIQKRLYGDQDWLFEATRETQAMLYPDSWVLSWKWEVRTDRMFELGGIRGNRKFRKVENVTPRPECCICVFHGDPNPHNCSDPWVVANWK